ncbi:hypothetical protein [Raineyella sp. W15-4]|uniref:hypothetical protein n=1 Tax=Raineyella sp. W15-4 TaxID=3081651 RepID=UPI0029547F49|nr:hypothetical protein [Raineyella sp. W15-4]WOQ16463.1 hypothetical protein R0145_14845 [Raineyella sp. W15-4]
MSTLQERLDVWRRTKNWVALGNLGEQVTMRLLESLDYTVLGTQDDYVGMVPDVLGEGVRAHPEDFLVIGPDSRLMTVNSKASASPRTCRFTANGDLTTPRLAHGQGTTAYSTLRGNLVSPLDGNTYAQVVKVDLVHLKAQIFEIDEVGKLSAVGTTPYDIDHLVVDVLAEHPADMPPPSVR